MEFTALLFDPGSIEYSIYSVVIMATTWKRVVVRACSDDSCPRAYGNPKPIDVKYRLQTIGCRLTIILTKY